MFARILVLTIRQTHFYVLSGYLRFQLYIEMSSEPEVYVPLLIKNKKLITNFTTVKF